MVAKQEPRARKTGARSALNKIAELNDAFRKTCSGGTLFATPGVIALGWVALPRSSRRCAVSTSSTPATILMTSTTSERLNGTGSGCSGRLTATIPTCASARPTRVTRR